MWPNAGIQGDDEDFQTFLELFPLPNGAIIKMNFKEAEVWTSQVITSHLLVERNKDNDNTTSMAI